VHRYPDAGSLALRQVLAARFGLDPEMVICTNGSDEMVFLLCLAFLREGDEAIMAHGSFISYYLRTIEMGGTAVRVPLRDYAHDLEAMAAAVTERTRLLFLCNPNNPTGTTNGAAEVRRLLDRLPADVLVVADEAYIEFVGGADYPDLLAELRAGRPNLVLLRTFAKIYGLAGLRLGYAFGHPDIMSYLERARPTFNVNALAQAAGLAALEDDAHVERSRAHADACRALFMRELRAIGLDPVPSATNFVAVRVGDDLKVTTALMDRGFTVTPLSGWGLPGHIRISFGTDAENARFFAAFRNVLGV
jgi:histidinol-phosphate aminotransferase